MTFPDTLKPPIQNTLVGNKIVNHADVIGYIFICDYISGFNELGKCNYKASNISFLGCDARLY